MPRQEHGPLGSAAHAPGPLGERDDMAERDAQGGQLAKGAKPADCWDQVAKFGFFRKRDIFGIPRDSDFTLESLRSFTDNFARETNPGWADFNHDFGEACAYYNAAALVVAGRVVYLAAKRWATVTPPGQDDVRHPLTGELLDGLFWHRYAITERGQALLANVDYVSPAFDTEGEDENLDPTGYTLFNIAWCSGPFLDGMKPLDEMTSSSPRVLMARWKRRIQMAEDTLKRYGVDENMADPEALKAAMRRYAADVDGQLARFGEDAARYKRFVDGMSDEEMARFKKFADDGDAMKRFRAHFADDESFKRFADGAAPAKGDETPEEEKAEKEAMCRALALPATARWSEIRRTFTAKYVGADKVAEMQQQLAALQQRDTERGDREVKSAAERFADDAIRDFRQTPDKRDLVIEAYTDAEKKKAGGGAASAERQLFAKNTFKVLRTYTGPDGHIAGTPTPGQHLQPRPDGASDGRRFSDIPVKGGGLVAKARELMAKNPQLTYEQAEKQALREDPSLYT